MNLPRRLRRLRRTNPIRELVRETCVRAENLVYPIFIQETEEGPTPVPSMPGISRLSIDHLLAECQLLETAGLRAVALFPSIADSLKDREGSNALSSETLVLRAIRKLKREIPNLVIMSDLALDPYTTHGHDGLLTPGESDVDNDRTVDVLKKIAVLHAQAGADWVAPSDMMDGRVGAIRSALDGSGFINTSIMAYSAKFASAYYGPFREAVGSSRPVGSPSLDKRTYQMDPANRREAMVEAALDEEEGADFLMVKPAGPYLDIIRDLRERTDLPIAAYQVSGEYAQIHAAAERGWMDLVKARDESLLSIRRAGADLIITYFAKAILTGS